MSELIVECYAGDSEICEKFARLYPEKSEIERGKSADGLELIKVVIENLPELITATVLLIEVLKARKSRFRVFQDGREVDPDSIEPK
ncbi:MAG: hypothetical protein QGG71_20920 [Pirellulaceae bacterium]|jgi:hypothetical protein|nr:hypothetical protein [Pirellulaceae bacterium]